MLVVKRAHLRNRVPSVPGGGTILFVSPTEQSYHPDPEVREEGGTPAIVDSVRAGLAFAVKDGVGEATIRARERDLARRALTALTAQPNLEVLGNPALDRLPIVSFGIRHPRGALHANFVVAVLSDLLGIQARSGCFCAGPYIHRMYPIDRRWSARMHAEAARGHIGAKLAFTRLTFDYHMSEAAFAYILDGVRLLADQGWKLLPFYRFDPASGLWRHRDARPDALPSLRDLTTPRRFPTAPERLLADQLHAARALLTGAGLRPPDAPETPDAGRAFERIRWFPLPEEAQGLAQRAA